MPSKITGVPVLSIELVALMRPLAKFVSPLHAQNHDKLFFVFMVSGVVARLALAPISSQGDLETFWLSAQRFTITGFDFFYFTHTSTGFWAYPPIWLWLATAAYLLSFSSTGYDTSFLFLIKLPMILADVGVAYVLYQLLGGEKGKLAATLWLVNPMSIFITSIFGQFDALVPALLIISVLGLRRGKTASSGVVYGASVMTKQYAIFAAPAIFANVLRDKGRKDALKFVLGASATAFLISLPFLISGARGLYLDQIWLTRSSVDYDDACCQFAGVFQFLSWLHDSYGLNFLSVFNLSYFAMFLVLGLATGVALSCRRIDYGKTYLMSMAAFLTLSWYVNPQYTIVFIPFMIYDILGHNYSKFWLVITLLPFLWPFSANGFGPYFNGKFSLPALGPIAVAISALAFFSLLSSYVIIRVTECTYSNEHQIQTT
jgi:Gpi18-like mannosyltransferase